MEDVEIQLRVRELIPADHERETLFEALRHYQTRQDLPHLLSALRLLLNEPQRLDLYDVMRPLILACHQMEYSRRAPGSLGQRLRLVRLERRAGESFGFCVKGGYEHGVGVFVTEVTRGLQAYRQGLRVGDEIVRVNGFSIAEAIHNDVLNLIRMRQEIILKVTHVGMVPVKDNPTDVVTWDYVDQPMEDDIEEQQRELKLFIDTSGHDSFGCGIRSGPRNFPGIFIERVRPGSLAEEAGLELGDQIMEVNGTSFRRISHKEAVQELKSSRQLNIVICKKRGIRLFANLLETASHRPNSMQQLTNPELGRHLEQMANLADTESDILMSSRHHTWQSQSETDLIEQQFNAMPSNFTGQSSGFTGQSSGFTGQPQSLSPPHDSNRSYGTSLFHTAAEVHTANSLTNGRSQNDQRDFEWTDIVSATVYSKFNPADLNGRVLRCLTFGKNQDLGIEVEGGLGSPLGGKIQVATVFDGGIADQSGKMRIGDQLMMISGHRLVDVTLAEADMALQDTRGGPRDYKELIYCESNLINDEDNVTYF